MTNSMKSLAEAMAQGAVSFTYTKKNGSTRVANGTLNVATIIANGYEPKDGKSVADLVRVAPSNVYFDLGVNDWRTFSSDAHIVA